MYKIAYKQKNLTITTKAEEFRIIADKGGEYIKISLNRETLVLPKECIISIKPYTEWKYYKRKRF